MGLFKKKEKDCVKCPACGSFETSEAKNSKALLAYPGFYSGTTKVKDTEENRTKYCKKCKTYFQIDE